jgi:hypothetical protein
MKIKVKPEGREGIWIPDKESLIDFLVIYEDDSIHNMKPIGSIMLGADHSKESVIEEVKGAERISIMTGSALRHNLNHSLAVITNNELSIFDIGKITESDLIINI